MKVSVVSSETGIKQNFFKMKVSTISKAIFNAKLFLPCFLLILSFFVLFSLPHYGQSNRYLFKYAKVNIFQVSNTYVAKKPTHIITNPQNPDRIKLVLDISGVFLNINEGILKCNNVCNVTYDLNNLNQADAVIYSMERLCRNDTVGGSLLYVPQDVRLQQIWVARWMEPPHDYSLRMCNYNSLKRFDNVFNWTFSYRTDSTINGNYGGDLALKPMKGNESLLNEWMENKIGTVLWLVSHCKTFSAREDYVEELKKHINVKVFGKCSGNPVDDPKDVGWEKTFQMIGSYKFYLSFENSLCEDYVTEKFFNILTGTGIPTVPIVMGESRQWYEKQVPPDSFIHVNDFDSPKALAKYLHFLDKNDTAYLEHLSWRIKYVMEFNGLSTNCMLCNKLYEPPEPSIIGDFKSYWYNKGCPDENKIPWKNKSTLSFDRIIQQDPFLLKLLN